MHLPWEGFTLAKNTAALHVFTHKRLSKQALLYTTPGLSSTAQTKRAGVPTQSHNLSSPAGAVAGLLATPKAINNNVSQALEVPKVPSSTPVGMALLS